MFSSHNFSQREIQGSQKNQLQAEKIKFKYKKTFQLILVLNIF